MARNRLALTAENVEPQIEINFMKMKLGTNYSHCLFFLLPRVHCVSLCGLVKGLFPKRLVVNSNTKVPVAFSKVNLQLEKMEDILLSFLVSFS